VSKLTEWADGLSLSTGGRKLVGKAGIVPVRRLADKVGLTDALSGALVRRDFHPVQHRGGVLVSAACAVLLGARSIAGIEVMRQAALVLGNPASASTLYRTLDAIGPVQLAKIASARAKFRSRVHDLLDLRPGGFPWIRVDGRPLTGWTVLDIDASLVPAHSDKEGVEPHRKGHGLHPILMFLDNTDEHLVCRLRPGSAGANTASDHIEVSTEAIRQLPTRRRRKVLVRADGAGATIEYMRWITDGGRNKANTWQYSVGWTRDEDFWTNLAKIPDKTWTPALASVIHGHLTVDDGASSKSRDGAPTCDDASCLGPYRREVWWKRAEPTRPRRAVGRRQIDGRPGIIGPGQRKACRRRSRPRVDGSPCPVSRDVVSSRGPQTRARESRSSRASPPGASVRPSEPANSASPVNSTDSSASQWKTTDPGVCPPTWWPWTVSPAASTGPSLAPQGRTSEGSALGWPASSSCGKVSGRPLAGAPSMNRSSGWMYTGTP
jgi:hypothetical protein